MLDHLWGPDGSFHLLSLFVFFPVLEILSVSNSSALSKDIELTGYPHTAVRRMWVYRVNSSATHPLRDQSFSFFWSYSLHLCNPVHSRALESDLGISRHLCNVRHVVESSRFYSIHPSAPTVEVQQKCWIGLWKAHCAHGVYIVNIH